MAGLFRVVVMQNLVKKNIDDTMIKVDRVVKNVEVVAADEKMACFVAGQTSNLDNVSAEDLSNATVTVTKLS